MIGIVVILPIKMNDSDARKILRRCVADDSKIFICQHARDCMEERNITRPQILSCLERGTIDESPYRDPRGIDGAQLNIIYQATSLPRQ